MKTILATTTLAFALITGAPAFAAPPPATTTTTTATTSSKPAPMAAKEHDSIGVVKAYDPAKGTLKLQNGKTYRVSADLMKQPVAVGQKVDVRWTMKDKHRIADRITPAK